MKVALVPGAPALLPAYGSLVDPMASMRPFVADAVRWLGEGGEQVALVAGSDPDEQRHGTPAVGARLVAYLAATYLPGSPWAPVGSIANLDRATPAVLLLCNGSARRSATAPGGWDDRAEAFDREVVAAIRDGDAGALAGLDLRLAAELMTCGLPELRALSALVLGSVPGAEAGLGPAPVSATLDYASAPYGVQYWVARWQTPSGREGDTP